MRIALKDILESEGYRVLTAADGEAGMDQAIQEKPDLILLDVMLPKLDGYSVCAELRRLAIPTPVLMLTAKGQVQDRVTGLDAGADDYLVKPFSTDELLARVRALLRRAGGKRRVATALTLGDVRIDFVKLTARRGRKTLRLTAKEFAVLRLLAEAAASRSRASTSSIWSGAARRFPRRAPWIITSPACGRSWSPTRKRLAGF